jgi:phage terminase large subunit-like protein
VRALWSGQEGAVTALVDRLRALSPEDRGSVLDAICATPGALSDLRYDWEGFWGREDQFVTLEELQANPIVFFTGVRGEGKTTAALHLFWWLIREGHVRQPRIFARTETDYEKVIVGAKKDHSKARQKAEATSGLLSIIPPEERPEWIKDEGVLRFRNGVEALCFAAVEPEQCVSHEGDCDLVDDIAKWGPHAHQAWFHQQASCRKGMGLTIAASTRRGIDVIRNLLGAGPGGPIDGVLIRRAPIGANRFNTVANLRARVHAVAGGDLARQDMDDEDTSAASIFGGLDFDAPPIRVLEVLRADLDEAIVAVDPADGKGGDHDEWGIGAAGRRRDKHVVALEDVSGSYDDAEAGEKILDLCERRGATKIVVETNRGPRVLSALRAAHFARELRRLRADPNAQPQPMPEIVPVNAKEGKRLRAGPVRTLYLDGLLHHVAGMPLLERQQRQWDPDGPKRPRVDDRIDWLVHAVTYLRALVGDDLGCPLCGGAVHCRQCHASPCRCAAAPSLALRPAMPQEAPSVATVGSYLDRPATWSRSRDRPF